MSDLRYLCIYVSPDSWVLNLFCGWKPVTVFFCCCSKELCGTHSGWLPALCKCPSFYQFLTSSCLITCFPCTRNYFTSQGEQRLEAKVRAQGVLPAPGVPASGPRRTELGNLCRMPIQSSIHTYCSVRVCVNSKHHEFTSILLIPFQHHTFGPASPYL